MTGDREGGQILPRVIMKIDEQEENYCSGWAEKCLGSSFSREMDIKKELKLINCVAEGFLTEFQ